MRRSFSPVLVAVSVFVGTSANAESPKKVAVLELQNPAGLAEQEARFLTDALRGQAVRLLPGERFQVMTRENILDFLPPGTDLADCEGECEVETGRKVGADYVITGDLVRFSFALRASLRIHDTRSGQFLAAETASGDDVRELEKALGPTAGRLLARLRGGSSTSELSVLGGDDGSSIVNPPTDDRGYIVIESEPKGALVLLNGKNEGVTPMQIEKPVGRYVVVVRPADELYAPGRREVDLTTATQRLRFELEPTYGVLEVTSEPPGADISLNGVPTGRRTPAQFPPQKGGSYQVTVAKLPLYLPETQTVTLGGGKPARTSFRLSPNFGSLRIESEPPGLAVLLDGRRVGTTPAVVEPVSAGVHEVQLDDFRYAAPRQRVSVERGQAASLRFTARPRQGRLNLSAVVVDEEERVPVAAEVFLDGERLLERTPLKLLLLVGTHELRLRADDAEQVTTKVTIAEGEELRREISLQRMLPEDVLARRAEHDRLSRRAAQTTVANWMLGIGLTALAAGGGGFAAASLIGNDAVAAANSVSALDDAASDARILHAASLGTIAAGGVLVLASIIAYPTRP